MEHLLTPAVGEHTLAGPEETSPSPTLLARKFSFPTVLITSFSLATDFFRLKVKKKKPTKTQTVLRIVNLQFLVKEIRQHGLNTVFLQGQNVTG